MIYYRLMVDDPSFTPLGFGSGCGRWNPNGVPVIYACNQTSLNFLELLSIKGSVVSQSNWSLVQLEIPGEIPYLSAEDLPFNWRNRPYPTSTQKIGSMWVQRSISAALKIPSCRIPLSSYPDEHNLLINPFHADFTPSIRIKTIEPVNFELNIL
jgi:RES domain-containing protein